MNKIGAIFKCEDSDIQIITIILRSNIRSLYFYNKENKYEYIDIFTDTITPIMKGYSIVKVEYR